MLAFCTNFFKSNSASGVILIIATILALIVANTSLYEQYNDILTTYVGLKIADGGFYMSISHWINDGLMAIFFLLVGLEIKRELLKGHLSSLKAATLPVFAAVGGMLVPALVYYGIVAGEPDVAVDYTNGWAIPAATDIAFALGVLSLLGNRVPVSLKVFLSALAIIDDLGAILIIAFFYGSDLAGDYLFYAGLTLLMMVIANTRGVSNNWLYITLGCFMWYFVYKSGVHATVAGVLTALCIPIKTSKRKEMLLDWEHTLAPIVYFVIMPIFAFANAGLSFTGLSINSLLHPVALGIALGLFVGKQVGVLLFSYVAKVSKIAKLPEGASILQVYGTGVLTGIGFTMSLFIGNLAFVSEDGLINYIRLGVFVGSLASALLGLAVLRLSSTGGVANVVGVNATTLSK